LLFWARSPLSAVEEFHALFSAARPVTLVERVRPAALFLLLDFHLLLLCIEPSA
jgi:hypothetical protein